MKTITCKGFMSLKFDGIKKKYSVSYKNRFIKIYQFLYTKYNYIIIFYNTYKNKFF